MEKYLSILFEQFKRSQGMSNHEKFDNHENEFKDWLSLQQTIKGSYAQLLVNMNVRDGLIAELGKGSYDSFVPNLNELAINAIAITPFDETFKNSNFAVDGKLILLDGNPIIKYSDKNNMYIYPNCNQLINTSISTLITQLPNYNVNLRAFVESSRQYNDVAIGSYGNTNDKDADDKVKLLRRIKETIENQYCVGCVEELTTQNGTYNHIIVSSQKKLTLEKSLYRTRGF